jgi:predicted nucleic acid-binding protein
LILVLDASVTASWCFHDERPGPALSLLNDLSAGIAVVPPLWHYEVANVLLIGERRQRLDRQEIHAFLKLLDALTVEVDHHTQSLTGARGLLELASSRTLSVYDAAYLEVAMRRGIPLATLDERLRAAAAAAAVEVLPQNLQA